jgi:succinate dehydrogenase / fumarate reductase cytochrome b subunit
VAHLKFGVAPTRLIAQRRYSIVKDKRPVNLDIGSMRLPITAWASIMHRATGVFLFAAMALFIWALDASLASPESFAALQETLSSTFIKLVTWVVVSVLIYHALAGVKHLVMDFGIGESMEGGILGVRIVLVLTAVLTLLAGILIW